MGDSLGPYALGRVHHADCLAAMRELPDGCVDAVVTDPPYGVGFRGAEWDTEIPVWIEEARRVAPVVVFTTGTLTLWDYPRPDWVLCWSRPASNSHSRVGGFSWWSPVVVYGRPRFKIDMISLHAIANAAPPGIGHLTPKPDRLMDWLVGNTTEDGGLVCDPFSGSGTTGRACVRLNRRFVGFDSDPTSVELSNRRIAAEHERLGEVRPADATTGQQAGLFAGLEAKP